MTQVMSDRLSRIGNYEVVEPFYIDCDYRLEGNNNQTDLIYLTGKHSSKNLATEISADLENKGLPVQTLILKEWGSALMSVTIINDCNIFLVSGDENDQALVGVMHSNKDARGRAIGRLDQLLR